MSNGKWVVAAIVGVTAAFGAAQWYFQTSAYYEPITAADAALQVTLNDGSLTPLEVVEFDGIDADTSPLRLRACFRLTDAALGTVANAMPYPDATPLIAPGWFECFNARAIGEALETGEATAILSAKDHVYGVDRVIAVLPDGRGFAWPQLNPCGEAAFSSDPLPPDCPPVPESS